MPKLSSVCNFHLTIFVHFFDLFESLLAGFGSILHLGNVSAVVEQKVVVHVAQLLQSLDIFQSTENDKRSVSLTPHSVETVL